MLDGMSSLALNQATLLFKNLNGEKNKFNNNTSLMLSYYNLAVQQEFLKRDIDARTSYSYCELIAQKESKLTGSNHGENPLFKKLKKVNKHLIYIINYKLITILI